ncbi:pentapeptide repeat-containing protein [Nocardia abscessus]|uniref:pentapeptide repeat-containing protein n=1 Tax=Nocardia abscessus TaxID=120957 RepID=UPI002453F9BF|nr:pentapeptide repeat-containing protein [Nocardia abscessus]
MSQGEKAVTRVAGEELAEGSGRGLLSPRRRTIGSGLTLVTGGVAGFGAALLSGVPVNFSQPLATLLAGSGALAAGILAYVNGQRTRDLTEVHHQAEMARERERHRDDTRRAQESSLRDRYTAIAAQIAHDSAAIRQAGVYALTALADDWHAFGEDEERQVCINLLQWYLRVPFPRAADSGELDLSELEIRQTIVGILAQRRGRSADDPKSWASTSISLHKASLPNSGLRGIRLTALDLSGANLADADLNRADLTDANLTDADLAGTDLAGADLAGAELNRTKLPDANLNRANLNRANLTHANLTRANLSEVTLSGANLTRAKLTEADVFDANLSGADLKRADLGHADLTSAKLPNADLNRAILSGAELTDADLTNSSLIRANLSGVNLTDADLSGANLVRADLSGAKLTDADLSGANLFKARLFGADLSGTNLTRAKLTMVSYDGSTRWPKGFTPPASSGGSPPPPVSE